LTSSMSAFIESSVIGRPSPSASEGLGSFVVGDHLIAYRVDGDNVPILRVLRGSRDIEALLRD
jgi:plasmid stabilization system protein ParE